ncbi:DUF551 domain-containing protein [Acinetobacter pollinis]|uniref:DUF551 domain-containing protein n=1 Tax=Acinetobacter pollinis TaxID=2605270 RepID=UPI0018A260EF|nr:DUF551 domain-containing protein [Acinetobacter pollinis]MBF7691572.1 DUF551 domain-containing protein [Acinetobacter pollinis]MBF7699246.1 DUF551 domain-containing protein [Acinetobacter pollinis]
MSEWISVKDQLPDDGEKVLVFILDTIACAEKDKVFGFIDVLTGEALRSDLITHWRPQVEPPKPKNLIDSFIADGGFDKAINEVK